MSAHAAVPSTVTAIGSHNATRCMPCLRKGHTCWAHKLVDGEPQCIYCLDEEPCLWELSHPVIEKPADKQLAPVESAPPTMPIPKARRAPRAHHVERVSPFLSSAVKGASEVQPSLTTTKSNGHAPIAAPAKTGKRLCKCKCGGEVPASSRFAYLKGHMLRRGAVKQKAKFAAATAAAIALPEPSPQVKEQRRCVLEVSESQLNKFLIDLPFEKKQQLANYYLRNEDL